MYPRQEYELTEEELKEFLEATKPQPVMKIGSHWTGDRQEAANNAWKKLGEAKGFIWDTCQPIPGKGIRFFSAIPSENEVQRAERVKREAEEKRLHDIELVRRAIDDLNKRLADLESAAPSA